MKDYANEQFRVYPDQLRDGRVISIQEQYDPAFMKVDEPDLKFHHPISVSGDAYLADENLVLHFEVHAEASLPCAICNEPVPVELNVVNLYHVEPLKEIKGGVFSTQELLREAILLEVPKFAECGRGNCPERAALTRFLKKNESDSPLHGESDGEGYRPFADIDLDIKPKT